MNASNRPLVEGKEFPFTKRDFEQIRSILLQKAGIKLADSKDSMVYSRLSRRVRALRLDSFKSYLAFLHAHPEEEQHFINCLTTNLTSFFREPHHFPALANFLSGKKDLRIWCAAASTGEEPYSIAMTVVETYETFVPSVEIIATDIDSGVLATAQQGIYSFEKIDKLSEERKKRFFYRGKGRQQGKVKVRPELTRMIQFKRLNLLDSTWSVEGKFDVIFCRNVMIYFDKPTQLRILERMLRLLKPNGLYIAGHSENFNSASHLIRPLGNTMYQLALGAK